MPIIIRHNKPTWASAQFWQGLNTQWPNASTTGPRIATTQEAGGTKSGFHSGKEFTSTVVPVNGAVFEDCIFNSTNGWAIDGHSIEYKCLYCKINPAASSQQACIGNFILEYCDIEGHEDGPRPTGAHSETGLWIVRRCFIHNPYTGGVEPHNDGIQAFFDDGLIEENYIDWADTSAVMVQDFDNQVPGPANVIVRHNWLGGADNPCRIESECLGQGCEAYENVIEEGFFGYGDFSGADRKDGNLDSITGEELIL